MKSFSFFVLLVLIHQLTIAQISQGGEPYSFSHKMDVLKAVSVNMDKQSFEEKEITKNCDAMAFAQFLPVNISLKDERWQKTKTGDGMMVYRLAIKSENAQAVGAYFSQVNIPIGAKLFVYSSDHQQLLGAFTSFNNKESAFLPTEYIIGDELAIEYMEPLEVVGKGYFIVNELLYAYRGINTFNDRSGFGSAGACEVNVNCLEGNNKTKQRDAVLRILVKSGSMGTWCSGTLVNNTSEDRAPYVLTADHCGKNASVSEHHQWVFYFDYQSVGCENPVIEPDHQTMVGCMEIASSSNTGELGSDFYLVRLEDDIPEHYDPYFIGWNRDGLGSSRGYTIHHPRGDIKKISHYTQPLVDGNYQGGIFNGFWEVHWSETESGYGVTEGGSSGSPIFDKNGYLIGTLTGGQAACNNPSAPDYYGKFSVHWESNGTEIDEQLAYWLDPNNTGQLHLGGVYLGSEELEMPLGDIFTSYPNPVSDNLNIYFKKASNSHQIDIYDVSGRAVQSVNYQGIGDKKIDMTGLAKGVYLLKVNDGNKTQITKFYKN